MVLNPWHGMGDLIMNEEMTRKLLEAGGVARSLANGVYDDPIAVASRLSQDLDEVIVYLLQKGNN
jgi:hypothetical protein